MDDVQALLMRGEYRCAAEAILEEMRSLAEEHKDIETANELDDILGKLFDIPNIDWKKAKSHGVWETSITNE